MILLIFPPNFFIYLDSEHYLSFLSSACFPVNTIQGSKLILLSFQEFFFLPRMSENAFKTSHSFPEIQETICDKLVPVTVKKSRMLLDVRKLSPIPLRGRLMVPTMLCTKKACATIC